MPEGDTLQQARLQILPILEGQRLEYFWARKLRGYRPRAGHLVHEIRVHGKHLLIDFDRKLSLRVHLGMGGYWRVADRSTADSQRQSPTLRLELRTATGSARCFSAPGVETFIREADITPLSNLGPDLVVPSEQADGLAATAKRRARLRCSQDELIADVLLDQQVAAGIGNVYKSEVLFLSGVHPLTPLGLVSDEELQALYLRAAKLLFVHSQPGNAFRVTTSTRPSGERRSPMAGLPRHHVYGRWRGPCLRCQSPIRRSYDGRLGRSSYWCPTCQPVRTADQERR